MLRTDYSFGGNELRLRTTSGYDVIVRSSPQLLDRIMEALDEVTERDHWTVREVGLRIVPTADSMLVEDAA